MIVLFSGGLDSILAARVLEEQGLRVRCLHCVSPFFGDAAALPRWKRLHGLDIVSLDVSADFAALLRRRPGHGFGKVMNPCVDCKILLLRHARLYMESVGARLLATGEVLGQRPMSQRRDTLHLIPREAEVDGLLLRPLCARLLPPIPAEENGLVDRSRLLGISGRGRGEQLALAARFGLREIPTPGGGCRLTERENARRYWPVLTHCAGDGEALARDFALANLGRQFWRHLDGRQYWLAVGRNNADNKRLAAAAGPEDALISLTGLPGPLSLARAGAAWPRALLEEAADRLLRAQSRGRRRPCPPARGLAGRRPGSGRAAATRGHALARTLLGGCADRNTQRGPSAAGSASPRRRLNRRGRKNSAPLFFRREGRPPRCRHWPF